LRAVALAQLVEVLVLLRVVQVRLEVVERVVLWTQQHVGQNLEHDLLEDLLGLGGLQLVVLLELLLQVLLQVGIHVFVQKLEGVVRQVLV